VEAVRETGDVAGVVSDEWLAARKRAESACVVGHADLLALPPA